VIELDGVPVQEFDLAAYRTLFGVVSQDGLLFNETVYQNIAYARPELSREDVERAARIANAENFILNDLDQGYDTLLGERGVRLSGGQRQRVAIARAVVHRPQILILDEATSALDSESERLVQDAISHVVKGHTSIVIAHRLSTILMADKIVVLRDGEIVETGTHKELLALNGEYSYLYNLQFHDRVVTPVPQPERTATV
jgi:ABC-type multidrug transport system fused ATPase/permease subunit